MCWPFARLLAQIQNQQGKHIYPSDRATSWCFPKRHWMHVAGYCSCRTGLLSTWWLFTAALGALSGSEGKECLPLPTVTLQYLSFALALSEPGITVACESLCQAVPPITLTSLCPHLCPPVPQNFNYFLLFLH